MKTIFYFILLLYVSPLFAQNQSDSVPENRVRIKTKSNVYKGNVVYIDNDSLQLKLERKNSTETFLRMNIDKIELTLGKKSTGLKGAGIGFGLGAVFGFGLGYAIEPGDDVPQLQAAGTLALLGGLAGAVIAAIEKLNIGRKSRTRDSF
ncbi:MAG: hypothetical protein GWN13_09240 [Phycisphaerae bacterium]|nr:hypothetical protein [Phycisphaerae bacterium]